MNALYHAADLVMPGHCGMLELLIVAQADIRVEDSMHRTALFIAARHGQLVRSSACLFACLLTSVQQVSSSIETLKYIRAAAGLSELADQAYTRHQRGCI